MIIMRDVSPIAILIALILCFQIIPYASAADIETSYVFRQHEYVNFRFRCYDTNVNYCTSTTLLLINVESPNGTNALDNQSLTANSSYFNVSLPTNETGRYSAIISSPSSVNTLSEFTYIVNPQGIEATSQRTLTMSLGIFFFILLGTLLFTAFLYTQQKRPVKWTYFIFSVILFVASLSLISVMLSDAVVNPNLETFFDGVSAIAFYFYWFAAGLLILMWIFTFFNTWILKKNLRNAQRFG
jgi:hypothetical protein